MRLRFVSIILPSGVTWNNNVMHWLLLLIATWICWIRFRDTENRYYCGITLQGSVPFPFFDGRSTRYTNRFQTFFVSFHLRCYIRMSMLTVSFLGQLHPPPAYDLNGFNSEQSEQAPFIFRLFLISFPLCFESLSVSFSCNFMPCSGWSAVFVMNPVF